MTTFDLRQARLRPGEEYRDEQEIELAPFDLGGQRYLPVPEKVPAELVIGRGSSGTTFELRFRTRLHGPCVRCLKDAVVDLPVYAREYQATNPGDAEELRTPYVTERTGSTCPPGRGTRSRSSCPIRSCAGRTAPASVPSAART